MKRFLFSIAVAGTVIGLLITITSSTIKSPSTKTQSAGQGFAVMELFTSQGCSSCPPADNILGKYAIANNEHIIPIAFHVDYWNRLGWKDPFSNSAYSQRQKDYASKLHLSEIYTPQLIVNGETEMVGSEAEKIKGAVNNALNEKPAVFLNENHTISGAAIQSTYSITGSVTNTTLISLLVEHTIITKVKAGENNGATLINYNIVRAYTSSIATKSGSSSLSLPGDCTIHDLSLILFTQDNTSGKITGVLSKTL